MQALDIRGGKSVACYPVAIWPDDVTSTRGLARNMLRLQEKVVKVRARKGLVTVIIMDIALYGPGIKFVYNHGNHFPIIKKYAVLGFPFWHPGKIVVQHIWEKHLHTVIGPLHRELFTGASERIVSFSCVETCLTFLGDIACAYERVRAEFQVCYNENPTSSVIIHHWQFFEFFVPVVSKYLIGTDHVCYVVCSFSLCFLLFWV